VAAPVPAMVRTACFDRSRRYRYALGREWRPDGPRVVFVMLNPSAADHRRDDPTIRRCIAFARAWGFGALTVVNLFAWRTAHPADLRRVADPVGPRNDAHLRAALRGAVLVVRAWGDQGTLLGRDRAVAALLARAGAPQAVLGLTARDRPRHPLYLSRATRPIPLAAAVGKDWRAALQAAPGAARRD